MKASAIVRLALAGALAAILIGVPAGAGTPMVDASVQDLVEQLAPAASTQRGLRNLAPERRQIDLVVVFDFDSARLQPASLPLLRTLAEALNTERLQALRFQVQGHTDAQGRTAYNLDLSLRRANAVVQFLQGLGVAAARLDAEGRGAEEPLPGIDPLAAENRRVRIVALP